MSTIDELLTWITEQCDGVAPSVFYCYDSTVNGIPNGAGWCVEVELGRHLICHPVYATLAEAARAAAEEVSTYYGEPIPPSDPRELVRDPVVRNLLAFVAYEEAEQDRGLLSDPPFPGAGNYKDAMEVMHASWPYWRDGTNS